MQRLDRTRLTRENFPFSVSIETRFSDMDVQHHINNVAVADIIQESRVRFNKSWLGPLLEKEGKEAGIVVGSLFIDYAAPMFHPGPVDIHMGVLEIGRTSITMGQVLRQQGRDCVYCESVSIYTQGGKAAPLLEEIREGLNSLLIS